MPPLPTRRHRPRSDCARRHARVAAGTVLGIAAVIIVPLAGRASAPFPHAQAAPHAAAPPAQVALAPVAHIGGPTLAVAEARGLVYAGVGPKLVVLDPTQGRAPAVLGESAILPGVVWDIAIDGSIAYVATIDRRFFPTFDSTRGARGGLALLDIADPARPQVLATTRDLDQALAALPVEPGTQAADEGVADGGGEPEDPGAPLVALDIAVALPRLFLATNHGVLILDVSNPRAPLLVGAYRSDGMPIWSVAAAGRFVFAVSSSNLFVVDVGDPRAPRLVACGLNLPIGAAPSGGGEDVCDGGESIGGRGLLVRGSWLYLATFNVVLKIDIHNPQAPTWAATWFGSRELVDVVADGRWIYGLGEEGLAVFDSEGPLDEATAIGEVDLPGEGTHLVVVGARAFVAAGGQGLRVVDVAEASFPREAGALISTPRPQTVALAGAHAFVADAITGLQIFDVADPARPRKVGAYSVPGARELALIGSHAYVKTTLDGSVRVVDVANPARPREVGAINLRGGQRHMVAHGGHLIVESVLVTAEDAEERAVLQVLDVTDPRAPAVVGSLPHNPSRFGWSERLVAQDGWLYVLSAVGLRLVELTDPHQPRAGGAYYLPRGNPEAPGLAVGAGRAYLAAGRTGFIVLDLAEPRNPVEAGVLPSGGANLRAAALRDHHAFVAQRPDSENAALRAPLELRVFDVSTPVFPHAEARFDTAAFYEAGGDLANNANVTVAGDYAYLVDARSGVYVLRIVEGPRVFLPWSGMGR